MFMIRRSALEAIGGFRELRGAGHEDWELYVRLALQGYKVEVIPELLQFYRQVEGSLARTLPTGNVQSAACCMHMRKARLRWGLVEQPSRSLGCTGAVKEMEAEDQAAFGKGSTSAGTLQFLLRRHPTIRDRSRRAKRKRIAGMVSAYSVV